MARMTDEQITALIQNSIATATQTILSAITPIDRAIDAVPQTPLRNDGVTIDRAAKRAEYLASLDVTVVSERRSNVQRVAPRYSVQIGTGDWLAAVVKRSGALSDFVKKGRTYTFGLNAAGDIVTVDGVSIVPTVAAPVTAAPVTVKLSSDVFGTAPATMQTTVAAPVADSKECPFCLRPNAHPKYSQNETTTVCVGRQIGVCGASRPGAFAKAVAGETFTVWSVPTGAPLTVAYNADGDLTDAPVVAPVVAVPLMCDVCDQETGNGRDVCDTCQRVIDRLAARNGTGATAPVPTPSVKEAPVKAAPVKAAPVATTTKVPCGQPKKDGAPCGWNIGKSPCPHHTVAAPIAAPVVAAPPVVAPDVKAHRVLNPRCKACNGLAKRGSDFCRSHQSVGIVDFKNASPVAPIVPTAPPVTTPPVTVAPPEPTTEDDAPFGTVRPANGTYAGIYDGMDVHENIFRISGTLFQNAVTMSGYSYFATDDVRPTMRKIAPGSAVKVTVDDKKTITAVRVMRAGVTVHEGVKQSSAVEGTTPARVRKDDTQTEAKRAASKAKRNARRTAA